MKSKKIFFKGLVLEMIISFQGRIQKFFEGEVLKFFCMDGKI